LEETDEKEMKSLLVEMAAKVEEEVESLVE
jgi:hypothetical protein